MWNLKKLKLNNTPFRHIIFFLLILLSALHLVFRFKHYKLPPAYKIVSSLPHIIDGDSVVVAGIEMRLLGIDAPELFQTCGEWSAVYACGAKAKQHLLQLIGNKPITCKYNKFDKYHRALAYCYLGDTLLNLQMIKDGWAVSYYSFKKAEAAAKKAKIGIWQSNFMQPKIWRKNHHHDKRPLANPSIS